MKHILFNPQVKLMMVLKLYTIILLMLSGVGKLYAQTPTTDLIIHQPTSIPAGATLEWHVGATSASALVANPSAVAPGIYYAFYNYGGTPVCYSEASPFRILTNSCPATTVDLSTAVNAALTPVGSTVKYYSNIGLTTEITGTGISAAVAGTYYTAYVDGTGCKSNASVILAVSTTCCIAGNTAPTLSATTITNCPAATVNLNSLVTSTCPSPTTLEWHTSTNPSASDLVSNPTAVSVSNTYYAVCYDGTNSCYSPVSVGVVATITPIPGVPTGVNASPSSICSGSSSTLSATCGSNTLTWYSDIALTVVIGSTVSPLTTTTYYAACSNGTCKSAGVPVTVTVTATPGLPTLLAASPNPVCTGASSSLTATILSGATAVWSVNSTAATLGSGSISGTTASNSLTSATAATYTVSLTQTVGGCTSLAATVMVVVNVCDPCLSIPVPVLR